MKTVQVHKRLSFLFEIQNPRSSGAERIAKVTGRTIRCLGVQGWESGVIYIGTDGADYFIYARTDANIRVDGARVDLADGVLSRSPAPPSEVADLFDAHEDTGAFFRLSVQSLPRDRSRSMCVTLIVTEVHDDGPRRRRDSESRALVRVDSLQGLRQIA